MHVELPDAIWDRSKCGHKANFVDTAGHCVGCAQRKIPCTVHKGRRTPTWNAETVPKGLLGSHRTVVWAELIVARGVVTFIEHETGCAIFAGSSMVIVPGRAHRIECSKDAEFHVQFYDFPEAAGDGR